MEKFKKKLKRAQNTHGKVRIAFLVIAVILVVIGITQSNPDKESWKTFDGMSSGEYYKQEIYCLEGPFAVYEDENGNVTYNVYAALTKDEQYILVKTAKTTDLPVYGEDVTEENFESVEPVEVYGYGEKVESDVAKLLIEFYNEGFEEEFLTMSNYKEYFGNCYIDTTQQPETIGGVCFLFAGAIIVTIIIMKLATRKNDKNTENQLKKFEEEGKLEIVKNEYEKYTVEEYKKVNIDLTENYIISYAPSLEIVAFTDVVNAYRTNIKDGIFQGYSYIALETQDNKKYYVGVKQKDIKKPQFDEALEKIKSRVKQGGR